MSTIKTVVNKNDVTRFLKEKISSSISKINVLEGGEVSQGFSYNLGGRDYVIRISPDVKPFKKDKFSYNHFNSQEIPIPKILDIGHFDNNYYYAISKKANGEILDYYGEKEMRMILPSLFSVLDTIHQRDISHDNKYGDWDESGKAKYNSWRSYIMAILNEDWFHWQELIRTHKIDKKIFLQSSKIIQSLIKYCPEDRRLVHGDYGFNNVLSDGKNITGVIDWGESKYGDAIFDISWLDFWSSNIYFADEYKTYSEEKGIKINYYNERILCYKLYIGLGVFHFFIESEQESKLKDAERRVAKILASAVH